MKPIKFPILSTLALFALSGVLAFYIPLPPANSSSDVTSKVFGS